MIWAILGVLCVISGIVLIVKEIGDKKNGVTIDAEFIGFSDENGTTYPKFKFTYEGEELVLTSSVPAKPSKFKYNESATVPVIFNPKNRKYVHIVGDKTNLIYGIAAIVLGGILVAGFFI